MDEGVIRKVTNCDLARIIELENKCFNNNMAYSPRQLKYLITKANSNCLAEVLKETLRGFIIILYKKECKVAGVETLNVDPPFQGNGIAKKLLKAAEEEMLQKNIKKIRLEVSMGNIPAVKLYEKSGFRIKSILKNYYYNEHHGTHDAFRMIKELTT
jgi:ribosomal protein S18 acetylase RimI-like enzyme